MDRHPLGKPNAPLDTPLTPAELRSLIYAAGLNLSKAARLIGVAPRTMERHLGPDATDPPPYPVQFALRALCGDLQAEPPVAVQVKGDGTVLPLRGERFDAGPTMAAVRFTRAAMIEEGDVIRFDLHRRCTDAGCA